MTAAKNAFVSVELLSFRVRVLLKSAVNKDDDDDDEKRYWNFLGVWGSVKPRKLKKFMKLTWNWIWISRGWWGNTDIF